MKMISATFLGLLLLASTGISGESTKRETAEVYFSPQGDFPKALVKNLMSAKKSVDIAMYSFFPSSKKDAKDYKTLRRNFEITPLDAIREIVNRKVKVRIVLNKATTDVWAKKSVAPLLEAGAEVYTTSGTMHEKYAVIDNSVVINGSGNWSAGAFWRYQENWIIFPPDKDLATAFTRNMKCLLSEGKKVVLDKKKEPKVKQLKKKTSPKRPASEKSTGAWFTTDNKGDKTKIVEDVLLKQIKGAKKTLDIAMAHFNTKELADAVVSAHKKGVKVRVLLDLGEYGNRNSQERTLQKGKLPLRYHTYSLKHTFSFAKLMHHKYMIIDGKTLSTGSYNWSRTAEHKNHENLQVFSGTKWKKVISTFEDKFDEMWDMGRDGLETFLERMKAKKGTKSYRRYIPIHFRTISMNLKELRAIRSQASKAGFYKRPSKTKKNNWDFIWYDREKRKSSNEFPAPPAKPFFDFEQIVISEVCHTPDRSESGEFIELYNGTKEIIDLKGYSIDDGDSSDNVISFGKRSTLLKPGKIALIVDPDHEGDFSFPRGVVIVTVGNKTIGNGLSRGDVVVLKDEKGRTRDSCPLTWKTDDNETIHRKKVDQYGSDDNWEVKKRSPGKKNR